MTLSYVFPPCDSRPVLAEVRGLRPGAALVGAIVSGLRLADGGWPLLGGADDFVPLDWPVPEFELVVPHLRGEPALRIDRYDRELRLTSAEYRPVHEAGQRPSSGASGSAYLEQWLARMLAEGSLRPMQERSWWPAAVAAAHASVPTATSPAAEPSEGLVLVVLPGSSGADVAGDLEDLLLDALDPEVYEVDGSLLGPDGAEVYVHGQDADALATRVAAALADQHLPTGTHLVVRSGPPGSRDRRVALG